MPVLVRKPAKAVIFPPKQPVHRTIHRYAIGGKWASGTPESWAAIANRYNVEAWDLILYNFQCRNPEEVNWCMQEFLHCTASNDGKNYSFSPGDKNPIVFIPPLGYHFFIPADNEARNLVISTLQSSELDMISFIASGMTVNRSLFGDVLKHVNSHTILCSGNPTLVSAGVIGRCFGGSNVMFVRDAGVVTRAKKATVVHEAVHAGFDVRKVRGLLLEGEVCAYVAEAIFDILASGTPLATFDPFARSFVGNNIRRWAAFIGKQAIQHALSGLATSGLPFILGPTNPALHKLRQEIAADPDHKNEIYKRQISDGVRVTCEVRGNILWFVTEYTTGVLCDPFCFSCSRQMPPGARPLATLIAIIKHRSSAQRLWSGSKLRRGWQICDRPNSSPRWASSRVPPWWISAQAQGCWSRA